MPVVDDVVAGAADHEGLAPLLGHESRPHRSVCTGLTETGQGPDLVHDHLGRFLAQLAPPSQEPGDQLLSRVGHRFGGAVDKDSIPLPYERYPAEPSYQWLLAVAFDPGLEAPAWPMPDREDVPSAVELRHQSLNLSMADRAGRVNEGLL